jgi:hypothetical protein
VRVLGEVLIVVSVFEAAGNSELRNSLVRIFGKGLIGASGEVFAIARKATEGACQRVGGIEITICGGPLVPRARAEDAKTGGLADRTYLAVLMITVELVVAAGKYTGYRRGAGGVDAAYHGLEWRGVCVPLVIFVAIGVGFRIELPAVAEIREEVDILEVRGEMVAIVVGAGGVVVQQKVTQHTMPKGLAVAALTTAGYAGMLMGSAAIGFLSKGTVLLHRLWSTQEPYMPFYEQAA